MEIIQAHNLTKQYTYFEKPEGLKGSIRSLFAREQKVRTALYDFSCTIHEGEFVGLMGPNGAGKTTLIKLLTGIIRPTSGTVTVGGFRPSDGKSAFKKSYAVVMGQKSQLWWDLPASDSLLLNKEIYEIPDRQYHDNAEYFTRLFDVKEYLSVPVRKLSLGERMKFELIASLLHMPKILFLDEPTIGLDAAAQRQIRAMLKTAGQERGITLLLTSHYTEDLLELTKRCIVLRSGHMIYDGDLRALLAAQSTSSIITVTLGDECTLPDMHDAEVVEHEHNTLVLRTAKENTQFCLQRLLENCDIADIKVSDDDVTMLVERVYAAK